MRELVGSKNTIGQMASVLKNLQKRPLPLRPGIDAEPECSHRDVEYK